VVLREHLEYLRGRGHQLPGDATLIAAAMGGMLSMLAYALLPAGSEAGPEQAPPRPAYSDPDILDTVTRLLLYGLAGPAAGLSGQGLKRTSP
jgi:hypothetical protein